MIPPPPKPASVLILGSGPVVIGQAAEFDYAGTQACRALRNEGVRTILVNSNPATIMTDPSVADVIYLEPLTVDAVEAVIARERPDGLLAGLGGQTALNCALDLVREGVLEQHGVELIAASREAIDMAEDRELFRHAMKDIGLATPRAGTAHSLEEAWAVQEEVGSLARLLWELAGGRTRHNRWRRLSDIPAVTPESQRLSKELVRRGFKFFGPTGAYAFMQAVGLVNDHVVSCFRHAELRATPTR